MGASRPETTLPDRPSARGLHFPAGPARSCAAWGGRPPLLWVVSRLCEGGLRLGTPGRVPGVWPMGCLGQRRSPTARARSRRARPLPGPPPCGERGRRSRTLAHFLVSLADVTFPNKRSACSSPRFWPFTRGQRRCKTARVFWVESQTHSKGTRVRVADAFTSQAASAT